jgi:hypothetical protein
MNKNSPLKKTQKPLQDLEINAKDIAQQIIELMQRDIETRDKLIKEGALHETYHPSLRKVHHENANKLEEIIKRIGIPTIEKIGKEGYEASWLIVQHAIEHPQFMKHYRDSLKAIVRQHKTYAIHFAYLSDRINFFEGRPQEYGTQFDWDDHGEMSPYAFDSLEKVNERRKLLGLNTLEEQMIIMRKHILDTNQKPPENLAQRKIDFLRWKKEVGWIK